MVDSLPRASSPDIFDQVDEIDESFLWPFLHLLDSAPKPAKPILQPITNLVVNPVTTLVVERVQKQSHVACIKSTSNGIPGSTRVPLGRVDANSSDVPGGYSAPLSPSPQKPATICKLEFDFKPIRQSAELEMCIIEQCRLCNEMNDNIPDEKKHFQRRKKRLSEDATYLDEFFAHYPGFPYDPAAPVVEEFYRMCNFFRWNEKDRVLRAHAHDRLKSAMVLQFNSYYGTDVNDIRSWRNLCQILNIFPIPGGLDACRKAVLRAHVNIVDLVDTQKTGRPVMVFHSLAKLSNYTITTGKYFPRDNAYAGGLLRFLLRQILNPGRSIRGVHSYSEDFD